LIPSISISQRGKGRGREKEKIEKRDRPFSDASKRSGRASTAGPPNLPRWEKEGSSCLIPFNRRRVMPHPKKKKKGKGEKKGEGEKIDVQPPADRKNFAG